MVQKINRETFINSRRTYFSRMSSQKRTLKDTVSGFLVGLMIVGMIALTIGVIDFDQFTYFLLIFVFPTFLFYVMLRLRERFRGQTT